MRQGGRAQDGDRCQANGRIHFAESGIGRKLAPTQRFNANHGLQGAAGSEGMTENSFRAGKRRNAVAKQMLQRLRFRQIVVARAGAVGVHIINRRRWKVRPTQGGLHCGQGAGAIGMRLGGVMRVATGAPAGETGDDFRAAFQGVRFTFEHEHGCAFAKTHSAASRVKGPAAL